MKTTKSKEKRVEVLLWSIAFAGFGQLLNKKYLKAFIFIILEVIINVKGNINDVIVRSFLLDMEQAIGQANYSWLMFYPCIYLFAIDRKSTRLNSSHVAISYAVFCLK